MSHEEQIDSRIRCTHRFLQETMSALITEKGFEAMHLPSGLNLGNQF